MDDVIKVIGGFFGILFFIYIATRLVSSAWYRSKTEEIRKLYKDLKGKV